MNYKDFFWTFLFSFTCFLLSFCGLLIPLSGVTDVVSEVKQPQQRFYNHWCKTRGWVVQFGLLYLGLVVFIVRPQRSFEAGMHGRETSQRP